MCQRNPGWTLRLPYRDFPARPPAPPVAPRPPQHPSPMSPARADAVALSCRPPLSWFACTFSFRRGKVNTISKTGTEHDGTGDRRGAAYVDSAAWARTARERTPGCTHGDILLPKIGH